jgi:hypothetical protein
MMGELSSRLDAVRLSELKARIRVQARTGTQLRAMSNNARLHHQDGAADLFERSAEFAERKAARLFDELLDLTEGYLKTDEDLLP